MVDLCYVMLCYVMLIIDTFTYMLHNVVVMLIINGNYGT